MGYRGGMSSAVHAMSVITAALAVTAMSCMGGGTEHSNPVSIGLDSTFDFGRFNRAVGVHALRFGDSVFKRDSLEILSALHVNVWADEDGDGHFNLHEFSVLVAKVRQRLDALNRAALRALQR